MRLFFTALMFYTRLPCPPWIDHEATAINRATRWFPFMGWVVALVAGAVLLLTLAGMPVGVVVALSIIASVLLTGGFHEDGLADVADGFGGGWTKARILEILKDSRMGAYGTMAIALVFLLKFTALSNIIARGGTGQPGVWAGVHALFAAHALSRLAAVAVIWRMPYARDDEDPGKAKPLATGLTWRELIPATGFGLTPLYFLAPWQAALCLAVATLATILLARWYRKWIGGYTGDGLGAVQQVVEGLVYVVLSTSILR